MFSEGQEFNLFSSPLLLVLSNPTNYF